MTRQKKEIWKRINTIEREIAIDMQLGCGFAPADAYDDMYDAIHDLEEELARLSHYSSYKEYCMDDRGKCGITEELPFV